MISIDLQNMYTSNYDVTNDGFNLNDDNYDVINDKLFMMHIMRVTQIIDNDFHFAREFINVIL